MSSRPSYWDICLAYLREAQGAWERREEWTSTAPVEQELGLSLTESMDFVNELKALGLLKEFEAMGASSLVKLTPRGLAFMERLPSLEHLLRAQHRAIDAISGPPQEEKEAAKVSVRDELLKTAISKGVDVAMSQAPRIWSLLRKTFQWLSENSDKLGQGGAG